MITETQMRELVGDVRGAIQARLGVKVQAKSLILHIADTESKRELVMKVAQNKIEYTQACDYLTVEKDKSE